MINFGILKSKIENRLTESYGKDTLKKDLVQFKKLVLENKNISKLYYLYDDLSSKKGLNESIVDDYINSCITIYENTVNKIRGIAKIKKEEEFNWLKVLKTATSIYNGELKGFAELSDEKEKRERELKGEMQ